MRSFVGEEGKAAQLREHRVAFEEIFADGDLGETLNATVDFERLYLILARPQEGSEVSRTAARRSTPRRSS